MEKGDVWLRMNVMLVPPDIVADLEAGNGMTVTDATDAVLNGAGVVKFALADDTFNDFPDQASDPGTGNWPYLPGTYVPINPTTMEPLLGSELDNHGDLVPVGVDNNGAGNVGDWGGFFPDLDLAAYTDYGFLVQLQTFFDTDGQEELYIVGGLLPGSPPGVIPEPVTMLAVLGCLGAVGAYLRRRF